MFCVLTFSLLLAGALGATLRFETNVSDIVGQATLIQYHPYQVAIETDGGGVVCGGSIISSEWVLTSARCVDYWSPAVLNIRSGSSYIEDGGYLHYISAVVIHHGFYNREYDLGDDIAMIKVVQPFIFSEKVKPISMATQSPTAGSSVVLSVWLQYSYQLRNQTLQVVDREECQTAFGVLSEITSNAICAALPEEGEDYCYTYSGYPLVFNGTLVGVTQYGCGVKNSPLIHTVVSKFRSWVTGVLGAKWS